MAGHWRKRERLSVALFMVILIGACQDSTEPEPDPLAPPIEPQFVTEAEMGGPGFVVNLKFLYTSGSCTGVVLSQHWLMTNAHCVADEVDQYGVFGANRLTINYGDNGTSGGPESYTEGAASFYIHPDYDGLGDWGDDFALVRLYDNGMTSGTFTSARIMGETSFCYFGDRIGAPMVSGYGEGTDPGDGEDCPGLSALAGWKRTGAFGMIGNCGAYSPGQGFKGWSPKSPFIREIYARSYSRTVCPGDSGGAIFFHYDGKDIVAGLNATGGDGKSKGPSIRRKLDWIVEKSNEKDLPLECQPGYSDVGPDWWSCTSNACAACHGVAGQGTPMAPSLRDDEWLASDGKYEEIVALINAGVQAHPTPMLPADGGAIGDEQARALAAYVWMLSRGSPDSSSEHVALPEGVTAALVEEGQRIFARPPSRQPPP